MVTLFVVLGVLLMRADTPGIRRLLLPGVAVFAGLVSVLALLDRMAATDRASERRALSERRAELELRAMAPGSPLACLDSTAGDTIESACETAVFAGPPSIASAIAYVSGRLSLLSDGMAFAKNADPDFADTLSGIRRAIELDRFGIAAHVLSIRDGCTADQCAVFALLRDTGSIKANLRVHAFDNYVGRYAPMWKGEAPPAAKPVEPPAPPSPPPPPVASVVKPAPAPPPAPAPTPAPPVPVAVKKPAPAPVARRYNFPSSSSIPPVSIMAEEPKMKPEPGSVNAPDETLRLPPKRKQNQAAAPE